MKVEFARLSINDTRPTILWLMNLTNSLVLVGNGEGQLVGSFTDWPGSVHLVNTRLCGRKEWSSRL